jgi:hypothetical protein
MSNPVPIPVIASCKGKASPRIILKLSDISDMRQINRTAWAIQLRPLFIHKQRRLDQFARGRLLFQTCGRSRTFRRADQLRLLSVHRRLGVPADLATSVKDFEDASSQGLVAGQFNLGYCLLNGLRIDRDVVRGAELIREAFSRDGSEGFFRISREGSAIRDRQFLSANILITL